MTNKYKAYYESELGVIEIVATDNGIASLNFLDKGLPGNSEAHPHLRQCIVELNEYFRGSRKEFSMELDLEGTGFQKDVWHYLLTIPYGKTIAYGEIADALGDPKVVRAVGAANGSNKIAIIIPCHRVIGKGGALTGYAGGLWRKEWLLKHEMKHSKVEVQLELF